MYMCLCKDITESEVEQVGQSGVTSAADLIDILGLDDELCCGRCALQIEDFLFVARQAHETAPHAKAA
jgi:bacterioferritin-associated ferredoxin